MPIGLALIELELVLVLTLIAGAHWFGIKRLRACVPVVIDSWPSLKHTI